MVSVNLTDKCNQKCIYCEIGQGYRSIDKRRLTSDDLFWIIDQMEMMGLKRLSMCGGEPFLFPDILDVVYYAYTKKIKSNITSNGMTIHMLNAEQFDLLSRCGTHINISIDSFDNEIQSLTRGSKIALKNAIKSVEELSKKRIPFTLLSTISKYNCHDLFDSFVTAYKLGIKEVLYQPVITYSNYPGLPAITQKHLINAEKDQISMLTNQLEKIYQFEKRHAIKSNIYRLKPWIAKYIESSVNGTNERFFKNVLERFYCRESLAVMNISYQGGIQPCGLAEAEINIKDNRDTDLFSQWLKAGSDLRKDLKNQDYPEMCNGCCHKFSRNMLASVMRYPVANRKVLYTLSVLLMARMLIGLSKLIKAGRA